MQVELSVVIVNYNGLKYLEDCLNSLIKNLSTILFEIIVVDNNSSDESCDFIKKNYPNVVLIASKENLGFGKGNNLGVQNAKGKTILLINNDTIVLDDLERAYTTFLSDEKFGVACVNMLDKDKKYLPAVAKFPTPFRLLKISFLKYPQKEFVTGEFDQDKIYPVDWVSGSFMFIRKEDYLRINGFDEDYFMYVEDVDLCKKMSDLGKQSIFLPFARYIHFVGFNKSREKLLLKGCEIYAEKHFKGIGLPIAKAMLNINRLVKFFKN